MYVPGVYLPKVSKWAYLYTALLTISHRAPGYPSPKTKRLQHSFKTVEWNVRFSKLQQQTVPQIRTGSGKTANTVTIRCVTRHTCLQVSWVQRSHSNRWCKVTLVVQVGRRSTCKRVVDQLRQLEHNTLTNRQPVELPQYRCYYVFPKIL